MDSDESMENDESISQGVEFLDDVRNEAETNMSDNDDEDYEDEPFDISEFLDTQVSGIEKTERRVTRSKHVPKTTKRYLTIEEKLQIIEEAKMKGFSQSGAAKRYGVARASISRILTTDKEKILKLSKTYSGRRMSVRKKYVHGKAHKVEEMLYEWFIKMKENGLHVTGNMLKEKAKEIDATLGSDNSGKKVAFSNGWMDKFKKRFNVTLGHPNMHKRAANAQKVIPNTKNLKVIEEWISSKYPTLMHHYHPENVYNLSSTCLFYRGLPDEEVVLNHKLSVLLCCNMNGSDKRRLLVIGNAQKPSGFSGNVDDLPVSYSCGPQSNMSIALLHDYLQNWDRELDFTNKKVVVLMDSSHEHLRVDLRNIALEYTPDGFVQPCDSGIDKVFKGHYRSLLCERILHQTDLYPEKSPNDLAMRISDLDAIHLCHFAWKRLSTSCIASCFRKAFEADFTIPNIFDEIQIPPYTEKSSFLSQIEVETLDADNTEQIEDKSENNSENTEECTTHEALIFLDRLRSYMQRSGCSEGPLTAIYELENTCFQHKIQSENERAQKTGEIPQNSEYFGLSEHEANQSFLCMSSAC